MKCSRSSFNAGFFSKIRERIRMKIARTVILVSSLFYASSACSQTYGSTFRPAYFANQSASFYCDQQSNKFGEADVSFGQRHDRGGYYSAIDSIRFSGKPVSSPILDKANKAVGRRTIEGITASCFKGAVRLAVRIWDRKAGGGEGALDWVTIERSAAGSVEVR